MLTRVRNLVVVALLALGPVLVGGPASAQVDGTCTVTFNGVAAERISTLASPLELGDTDTLVFAGSAPDGTTSAVVSMLIGPITAESRTTTYATPASEFSASIALEDVSAYGIGLFRVTGTADGCVARVWVRVSGRFPLATLTGLTAIGLTLGGVTGQLGAIVSRRRWARSAAALGGVATGAGVTVLGQQFGRLQLSFPSLAAICAGCALLGFLGAWWLNPELREARRDRNRLPLAAPSDGSAVRPAQPRVVREHAAEPLSSRPVREPAPPARPAPAPEATPYWCYVLAPTDVFDLNDHTATVATLQPGSWYLAKRTVGGWAHVVAGDGREGWVAEGAVHRQG